MRKALTVAALLATLACGRTENPVQKDANVEKARAEHSEKVKIYEVSLGSHLRGFYITEIANCRMKDG